MKVEKIHDGSATWLLVGSQDPEDARRLVNNDEDVLDWVYDDVPEDEDWELDVVVERAGLFRKAPCSPRSCGDHGWHLMDARGPGPGAFKGVYFDVKVVTLQYDIDLEILDNEEHEQSLLQPVRA